MATMPQPALTLEALNFYRPWCRGCGAKEGPCVIASDEHRWVQDEDDFGYPFCLTCIEKFKAEACCDGINLCQWCDSYAPLIEKEN